MRAWLNDKFPHRASACTANGRVFGDLVPEVMRSWAHGERFGLDRPMSICVVGPSRLGKTEWARSLGRHAYLNSIFAPGVVTSDAEYLVIDDCGWKDWRQTMKPWIGAQKEITVRPLYHAAVTVSWGKPCIILANDIPDKVREDAWWTRNVITVDLDTRLF